jgi:outer membrane protein assembly factor BamB
MTTDGSRVYVLYGTGDLAALNMDGKVAWTKNLGVPDNHYGHSSSLLTWDGRLLIQYDTNRGGRVLSVNTQNGQIQWDKQRNTGISWASPILAQIDGKYQVILNSAPIVAGYDISNGNELWSHDCMMGEVGPSPAFAEGIVYATNEYARLVALKPGNPVTVVWEDDEYMPEVASPVISEGLLFIATSYGIIVCYDAKDGTKYWEDMLDYGFYSSPMVAEGKVYNIDMQGNVYIYEVSREMNRISEPKLGERCVSTPTFADGRIYLRGDTHLFCIGTN